LCEEILALPLEVRMHTQQIVFGGREVVAVVLLLNQESKCFVFLSRKFSRVSEMSYLHLHAVNFSILFFFF
jgi:hypothetical protein